VCYKLLVEAKEDLLMLMLVRFRSLLVARVFVVFPS
jgi:hypothetical protein